MATKTDEPKHYKFLKTAQGSRDGLKVETFNKGDVHPLDDALAEQFFHQGVIEQTDAVPDAGNAGPASPSRTGEAGVPLKTQRIEELVSVARDKYGLNVDSTMTEDQVRELIEQARGKPGTRETKVSEPEETKPAKAAEHKTPGRKPKR